MGLRAFFLIASLAWGAIGVAFVARLPRPSWIQVGTFAALAFGLPSAVAVAARNVGAVAGFTSLHAIFSLFTITLPVVGLGTLVILAKERRLDWAAGAVAVVCLLPSLVGVYARYIEPGWLRVDTHTLAASVAGPIRVAVLADLQTPSVGDHENKAIDELIAAQPDLVVIAGDMWQLPKADIPETRPDFDALIARLVDSVGLVVLVEGDHDRVGDLNDLAAASGAVVLYNTTTRFDIGGRFVTIAGMGTQTGLRGRAAAYADLHAAAESDLTIVLAHHPHVVFDLPGFLDPDLIVSGHTHGGQVQIPFFGPVITRTSVPRNVAGGGLHVVEGHDIYVSTGVGMERGNAPQIRFGARPSIGVIDVLPR